MPSKPVKFDELEAWMGTNGWKLRPFAAKHGIDKMTLHRLLAGNFKRFDPGLIARISKATAGAVAEPQFAAFFARRAKGLKRAA